MERAASPPCSSTKLMRQSPEYGDRARFDGQLRVASLADTASAAQILDPADALVALNSKSPEQCETAGVHGLTLRAAIDAFRKEALRTPVQKAGRDVLNAMKITEGELKAMPPDQRRFVEKRIADNVLFLLKKRGQTVPKDLEGAMDEGSDETIL